MVLVEILVFVLSVTTVVVVIVGIVWSLKKENKNQWEVMVDNNSRKWIKKI